MSNAFLFTVISLCIHNLSLSFFPLSATSLKLVDERCHSNRRLSTLSILIWSDFESK